MRTKQEIENKLEILLKSKEVMEFDIMDTRATPTAYQLDGCIATLKWVLEFENK